MPDIQSFTLTRFCLHPSLSPPTGRRSEEPGKMGQISKNNDKGWVRVLAAELPKPQTSSTNKPYLYATDAPPYFLFVSSEILQSLRVPEQQCSALAPMKTCNKSKALFWLISPHFCLYFRPFWVFGYSVKPEASKPPPSSLTGIKMGGYRVRYSTCYAVKATKIRNGCSPGLCRAPALAFALCAAYISKKGVAVYTHGCSAFPYVLD